MLKNIEGLSDWHYKDCINIYKLRRQIILKQDESNGEPKSTVTIKLGGKSTSFWKTSKRQFFKVENHTQGI
jgi:hypothetical protein